MVRYSEEFPQRYFDVGIAEQHAVTFAAGMACEGLRPVVAIYSTFLQRGYDQLIHDVAIQNLPVTFALDRGGLVGGDGATHNGAFDFAYLRTVPNLTVMAPADENECRQMLTTAFQLGTPAAVRYPRGAAAGGGGHRAARRCRWARASCGATASASRSSPSAPCSSRRWRRPRRSMRRWPTCASSSRSTSSSSGNSRGTHELLVTVEEHQVMGGAGSAVCEALNRAGHRAQGAAARFARPFHRPRRSWKTLIFRGVGRARDPKGDSKRNSRVIYSGVIIAP